MGRPLTKDVNGVRVLGTFGTNTAGDKSAGIRVTGKFGGATNSDYFLVKQRGAKTYIVSRDGVTMELGVLVETIANDGDILITGSPAGLSPPGAGNAGEVNISIAKLTKRMATDFQGNRYKWYLSNFEDSSGDYIVLEAV